MPWLVEEATFTDTHVNVRVLAHQTRCEEPYAIADVLEHVLESGNIHIQCDMPISFARTTTSKHGRTHDSFVRIVMSGRGCDDRRVEVVNVGGGGVIGDALQVGELIPGIRMEEEDILWLRLVP